VGGEVVKTRHRPNIYSVRIDTFVYNRSPTRQIFEYPDIEALDCKEASKAALNLARLDASGRLDVCPYTVAIVCKGMAEKEET